jgi:hypothetical protein
MIKHVEGFSEIEIPHFDKRTMSLNFIHDSLPEHGKVCGGAPRAPETMLVVRKEVIEFEVVSEGTIYQTLSNLTYMIAHTEWAVVEHVALLTLLI